MSKKQNWYTNPRKYHFIYKTMCLVDGKFYYGMHSTDSLDDGYIGSGTRLWKSIKKYGRENFQLEILEFCLDRESLKTREREVINEELLLDPLCMNLMLGGDGGWEWHNKNPANKHHRLLGHDKAVENGLLFFSEERKARCSEVTTELHASVRRGERKALGFTDKDIRLEMIRRAALPAAIEKRKQTFKERGHQQGEKNSNFGTMWITNEVESKKIKKSDLIPEGWRKGRKIKFVKLVDSDLAKPESLHRRELLRTIIERS